MSVGAGVIFMQLVARFVLAAAVVLTVIFVTPIIVYGLFQSSIGAEMPGGVSPRVFTRQRFH
jgi:hypothetical protein